MEAEPETDVMRQARLRAETRLQASQEFLQRHELVGLRADEAQRRVRQAGIPFRTVDAAQPIFSADLRTGRITLMLKGVLVVSAEVGN